MRYEGDGGGRGRRWGSAGGYLNEGVKHGLSGGRRGVVERVRAMETLASRGERKLIRTGVEAGATPYCTCTFADVGRRSGIGWIGRGVEGGGQIFGEGKERFATALELGGETTKGGGV